jgi:2-hydroxy-3-keto-5-methylthiopentenyl-1-phosphate phosphatase
MKRMVFCDFDGTITVEETFIAMLNQFTPECSARIVPEIYTLRTSLRDGVRQMMESIPSSQYPAILEFSRTQPIRPGFVEFLDFLDSEGVPFVVISGGVRGMVETVLAEWMPRIHAVRAMDVATDGEYLQVSSEFEGETELVEKVKAIATYGVSDWIAIGDSVTDLNMAMAAPTVFARSRLCHYLDDRQKPYHPFEDFFEIRDALVQLWR